ncbi:MAG: alpha/beta fold hydrolase [Chloroflexi bacterium]|nr:alpha/beta fold hydrolase [Chloroflexota bacterium]
MNLSELGLFSEEVYQPFFWPGGPAAALLVHGFPGTPAEVRPLAAALHAQGWTVHAPLLPGFGPQIADMFTYGQEDWVTAVRQAQTQLRSQYETVLLVGYSLGGAIALNIAAQEPPNALVLLAPFWQIGGPAIAAVWRGIRQLFPEIQFFKWIDFSNPQMQRVFENWRDVLDLDDPQVQAALQSLRVPARFVDEILALGQAAKAAAPTIHLPTLVIQGSQDITIAPKATHELMRSLGGQVHYHEFATGHELTKTDTAVWPHIQRAFVAFAEQVRQGQTPNTTPDK